MQRWATSDTLLAVVDLNNLCRGKMKITNRREASEDEKEYASLFVQENEESRVVAAWKMGVLEKLWVRQNAEKGIHLSVTVHWWKPK